MEIFDKILAAIEENNTLLRALVAAGGITAEDHMMEPQEAADYLHVTYDTVLRWAREGKIPSSRPGRKVLFSQRALEEFAREQSKASMNGVDNTGEYGTLRKIV